MWDLIVCAIPAGESPEWSLEEGQNVLFDEVSLAAPTYEAWGLLLTCLFKPKVHPFPQRDSHRLLATFRAVPPRKTERAILADRVSSWI